MKSGSHCCRRMNETDTEHIEFHVFVCARAYFVWLYLDTAVLHVGIPCASSQCLLTILRARCLGEPPLSLTSKDELVDEVKSLAKIGMFFRVGDS